MRIAVVCPNYTQGRSYQENIWAEQLAKMGHAVRVFFSGQADTMPIRFDEQFGSYETQQVATKFLPRSTFKSTTVAGLIEGFQPELIVLYGDKLFCKPICQSPALANVPVVSTYSENLGMHEFDWRKRGITMKQRAWAIGFILARGGPIRVACRRSAVVVGNTPQARGIILPLFPKAERPAIDRKMIDLPLGFSPDHFGFRPDQRQRTRHELGMSENEIMVCVSSHFAAVKEPYVKMIIDALRRVMNDERSLRAAIVGFDHAKHADVSQRIEAYLVAGAHANRFTREPFADRKRLCELYNASDIAVFGRASISCQEALGTGLVAVFSNDGSLNHLVKRPDQGVFFEPNDLDDLATKLGDAARIVKQHEGPNREVFRRELANTAAWLSYDRIINTVLDLVKQRNAGAGRA